MKNKPTLSLEQELAVFGHKLNDYNVAAYTQLGELMAKRPENWDIVNEVANLLQHCCPSKIGDRPRYHHNVFHLLCHCAEADSMHLAAILTMLRSKTIIEVTRFILGIPCECPADLRQVML